MNIDLSGKVCVVTGGARGIGRSIAEGLAGAGAQVAILDLSIDEGVAEAISGRGTKCIGVACDVSDPASVNAARLVVETELGPCDILVNNAAVFPVITFANMTFEQWKRAFDVNIHGMFLTCKAFTDSMQRKGWGRIINIGSIQYWTKVQCGPHYTASKGAVYGLTRALADELGPSGITSNAIAPGAIGTETALASPLGDAIRASDSRTAVAKVGQPEDLAGAAVFLASDHASFITGQTLVVDGGIFRL